MIKLLKENLQNIFFDITYGIVKFQTVYNFWFDLITSSDEVDVLIAGVNFWVWIGHRDFDLVNYVPVWKETKKHLDFFDMCDVECTNQTLQILNKASYKKEHNGYV